MKITLCSFAVSQSFLESDCHLRSHPKICLPRQLSSLEKVVQPPSLHPIGFEGWEICRVEPALRPDPEQLHPKNTGFEACPRPLLDRNSRTTDTSTCPWFLKPSKPDVEAFRVLSETPRLRPKPHLLGFKAAQTVAKPPEAGILFVLRPSEAQKPGFEAFRGCLHLITNTKIRDRPRPYSLGSEAFRSLSEAGVLYIRGARGRIPSVVSKLFEASPSQGFIHKSPSKRYVRSLHLRPSEAGFARFPSLSKPLRGRCFAQIPV